MARSSHGPRAVSASTVGENPAGRPRVVRLGRAANDNAAEPHLLRRLLTFGAAGIMVALVLRYFGAF